MKNWIKEHADTVAIICAVVGGVWTAKGDMHSLDTRLTSQIHSVDDKLMYQINDADRRITEKINGIDKRLITIETIMIMQGAPIKSMCSEQENHDTDRSS